MTCIVGIAEGGTVWIGGDSAGVETGSLGLVARSDKKVFRNGNFVMGFTSSFRMGQLLAYKLSPPKRHADDDVMAYMVNDFIDAVRECLKKVGYAQKTNDEESGGTFLVGYAGRLFHVSGDYQVGESVHGFDACGCGEKIALGALYSTKGAEPEKRLRHALTAAETFSAGVRSPFVIEQTDTPA